MLNELFTEKLKKICFFSNVFFVFETKLIINYKQMILLMLNELFAKKLKFFYFFSDVFFRFRIEVDD